MILRMAVPSCLAREVEILSALVFVAAIYSIAGRGRAENLSAFQCRAIRIDA
jgi:hypothetical protein